MASSRRVDASAAAAAEDHLLRQRDENTNLKRQVQDYESTIKR
jgi:hypothetical protein